MIELILLILGLALAFLAAIAGIFAVGGALLAFITLFLVRDLLVEMLPIEMPREAIQSLKGFWVVVPVCATPVLVVVLAVLIQHWGAGWQVLVGASALGYVCTYYHQLIKTSPQCPQWMQFVAERELTNFEHKMAVQRQNTDHAIQQEIREYFSTHPPEPVSPKPAPRSLSHPPGWLPPLPPVDHSPTRFLQQGAN